MQEKIIVPEFITIHMGSPDSDAANITVNFVDYIKNVASGEVYPTWPESALRANIYAIVTFALNRIYTQWYRSRGYNFDITSDPKYDMTYIEGRNIYQNISDITDELFNKYIANIEFGHPIFSEFCDGKDNECNGLSQWGSVLLANEGYVPYNILTTYYGDDITIETSEVEEFLQSWGGNVLDIGSSGEEVLEVQKMLNALSGNYPEIPKIPELNAIYDDTTAAAVRKFQDIFFIPETGVVDENTWYRLYYIYRDVKSLKDLLLFKNIYFDDAAQYPGEISVGDEGKGVETMQYILSVLELYYESILPLKITGMYNEETADSLRSFQRIYGLPQTGSLDRATWQELMRAYLAVDAELNHEVNTVDWSQVGTLSEGMRGDHVRVMQEYLSYISNTYPEIAQITPTGYFGPMTKTAVVAFQKRFGLIPNGIVNNEVWRMIVKVYSELYSGFRKRPYQNPGYIIKRSI